jgi:putative membrane protein
MNIKSQTILNRSAMKKQLFNFSIALMMFGAIACQNQKTNEQASADERAEERAERSEEIASDANDDKFDANKEVRKDADFVADQVASNMAEMKLAKLAVEKSSVDEVRKVAKMLESDHAKKVEELQSLAKQKSMTVPIEADKNSLSKLTELRDEKDVKNFNEEWCEEMVNMHEKKIEMYEDQLEKTTDPDLKSWISQTLPGLRSHLDQLKACHDKLKDA